MLKRIAVALLCRLYPHVKVWCDGRCLNVHSEAWRKAPVVR